jgi:hypothetical protein
MAKIIDPSDLNQNIEVTFNTGSFLIELNYSGNLSADGVSMQALYSFIKEQWKADDNLVKFAFPMISITTEQFELINGWNLSGSSDNIYEVSSSFALVRDAGWAVVNAAGNNTEEWINLTTLGTFSSSLDRAYYYQESGGEILDTIFDGPANQGIRVYASASFDSADYDYRSFFKVYLREKFSTYAFYNLISEQNLTTLDYRKFALPLTNQSDLNISASDSLISTAEPYLSMGITYFTSSFQRLIGATSRSFHVLIDGNSGTKQQIYDFIQYSLRQSSNIDGGDNFPSGVTGSVAEELLEFVGDTLKTKFQTEVGGNTAISGGVFIDNFLAADTNTITFVDDLETERTFPFVAAGNLLFNENLTNDSDAIYKLFFTSGSTGEFGTQNAVIILDNSDNPITGSVDGTASIAFDYDYDNNEQRGAGTSGSDVPFTGVALGLGTAQYVVTTGTWTRSTANTVNFVAALERNYSNPA